MPPVTLRTTQLRDPVLTGIARHYRPTGFVADQLLPRQAVAKESGKYMVFEERDFFATDVNYLKPDRSKTKEIDFQYSTEPYLTEEYAVKVSISRRERENADAEIRLEQTKTELLTDQLTVAREVRVATILQESGTAGGQLDTNNESTPSTNWDQDAATIEADLKTANEGVYDDIGQAPNTLVLPYKVANAIAIQQDIREILKYTVNGQEILRAGGNILPASLWGLRVLVPTARKTASAEGASSVTYSDVWGDDPRVLWVNPNAAFGNPSVGYTFQTRSYEVRRWNENDPNLEYIEASEVLDERVVAPKAGWHIKDVLS